MSHERYIDLVHGEIDGVNSPADSAELRKIIDNEDTAREFHEDMKRLAGVLDRVEDAEVPEGLRESIRFGFAAPVRVAPPLPFRKRAATGLRFAAALAAGVILGLIAGPRIFDDNGGWNPADFGGSMMPDTIGQRVVIDLDVLSGTVHATQNKAQLLVSFDFSAHTSVTLALGYDPGKVGLTGFARREGNFEAVEAHDGQFVVAGSGQLSGTLALERLDPAQTTLRLEYRREGELLGREVLNLNALD